MANNLTIEDTQHGDFPVIDVRGEIDLATAPTLAAHLSDGDHGSTTILDLSGVSFIDSTGLRVLLSAHEEATTAGGRLVIIAEDGPVTKLFSITGVDDLLLLRESRDAAVADA